jgi:hypothetical protein
MSVQPLVGLLAGVVWRGVAAGWWVSRGWYVTRTAVLGSLGERDAGR